jgi:hypothetical protein
MTQEQLILDHLKAGYRIDPIKALREYGCFRLGARIYDLRRAGHNITSDMVVTSSGKRVAEYRMGESAQQSTSC